MSGYPDCETYKALYKKYYSGRKPAELLDLAGDLKGKTIVDICAGDGRLSLEAAKRGAQVYLIEQEKQMISQEAAHDPNIRAISSNIFVWMDNIQSLYEFDCAFCQQGVNYWLNAPTISLLPYILRDGGLFIFNTFNKRPPEKPMVKEYELDGKKFVETSWLVGDTIHHVQVREGMEPHTTSFQWLSPEYLDKILSPYFTIEVKNDGPSALYRCSRK